MCDCEGCVHLPDIEACYVRASEDDRACPEYAAEDLEFDHIRAVWREQWRVPRGSCTACVRHMYLRLADESTLDAPSSTE